MAITVSGLYVTTWEDILDATQLAIDLSLTTHKIALLSNAATPNFSTDSGWTNANEVAGTGWLTGGKTLATAAVGGTSTAPTLTESPTGSLMYDMGDINAATTTLTAAHMARIYADALAGKNLIVGINFGADYSTVAGTFAITWDALGVFAIDLTP